MKRIGWLSWMRVMGVVSAAMLGTQELDTMAVYGQEEAAAPFGVGSKAPALDIEHWVSNGNGAFKPVTKFEDGTVYIVEFWATWCGPCIMSMPHLAETQDKYKDKKVQLISVSDEDLETVNEFLERTVRGEDEKTYRQLTSSYCLTTDPDQSVFEAYMTAAGQNGIPTAFIVGKKGEIEWIGHPMEMDEPLEQIVADSWDRAAYQKKMEAEQATQRAIQAVITKLQSGEFEEGLTLLDKLISETKDPQMAMQLQGFKLSVMMQTGTEESKLIPVAKEVLKSMASEPMAFNNLAWAISEQASAGVFSDKAFLAEVAAMSEKAAEAGPKEDDWQIWDTAGHLYYQAGNLDKAIETQRKAVANPNSAQSPEVAEFLKQLEAEKK